MLRSADSHPVNFWKSIREVVVSNESKILSQVDDFHVGRNLMLADEDLALAMTKAEEDDVNLIPGHLAGEAKIRLTHQTFMDIAHQIPCIALAVSKDNLRGRMIEQYPDQFAASIAGST